MSSKDERQLVESALFSAGRAISLNEIKEVTGLSQKKILRAINDLIEEYNKNEQRAIEIVKAGEKYAMQLKPNYVEHTRTIAKPEIPTDVLKTLALIAYHQPIKQSDLRHMLGQKIYEHVDLLVEKRLINSKKHGTTELLTTSSFFPEYFGIDKTNPDEIKEFLANKIGIKGEK
ncbi:MAG TPA: SMC-Scp complex subunit ScpB [Thermoplasmatales archaeon]|nr:SMC-Scp complex subunit ScpB [Thermoplasmatales archaeon]HEX08417.1 SMC-Scp complex subunit ScpB [Thermoplasmatales archaeon]